jgi:hypothetical protein
LYLVASVKFGGEPHAMVLDTIDNGEFVFKNTQSNNVQVKVPVNAPEAPDEFYFVHIKVKENEIEQIKQRLAQ